MSETKLTGAELAEGQDLLRQYDDARGRDKQELFYRINRWTWKHRHALIAAATVSVKVQELYLACEPEAE